MGLEACGRTGWGRHPWSGASETSTRSEAEPLTETPLVARGPSLPGEQDAKVRTTRTAALEPVTRARRVEVLLGRSS
jgi:hypothetical protein